VIVGAASCPNPPLLLPGITGQPVAEVEQLRAACLAALEQLLASEPDRIVLIGGRSATESAGQEPDKPLSVTVGRLLLAQAGAALPIEHLVVAEAASTADCLRLGASLAVAGRQRTGLLVMADGSARRSLKAPGYLDERATPYDAEIEKALAGGDPTRLATLEPVLAGELLVAGRAAWQVMAGAVGSQRFTARMHYSDAPFGVWYPVASWLPNSY
jgi:hypothetical protein